MDYSDERQQHIEDTEYSSWESGMYVMLEDLKGDHELALVENSLRRSSWEDCNYKVKSAGELIRNCMGVYSAYAGAWMKAPSFRIKLTRAQALYIATGDVNI